MKLERVLHTTFSWRRLSLVVGTLKPSGALKVGSDEYRFDVFRKQVRNASNLGITESMEREARLESLRTCARKVVGVRRLRPTQRARAQFTVFDDLRVTHDYLGTGRKARGAQPHPTDRVLAEIDERAPSG